MVDSLVRVTIRQIASVRNAVVFGAYLFTIIISLIGATLVGFDFEVEPRYWRKVFQAAIWVIPMKILFMWIFGQFRGLLMFFRMPDLVRLFWANSFPAFILILLFFYNGTTWVYPRRVILLDFVFSFLGFCLLRMTLRTLRERYLDAESKVKQVNVAIYGSGDTAARIAAELLAKRGLGKRPVVFIDGEQRNLNRQIHGIKVISNKRKLKEVRESYQISEVLIANPDLTTAAIRKIRDEAVATRLKVEIIPGFEVFLSGKMTASSIREISIEDLLPREETMLDSDSIAVLLKGKCVMVTGGGGSIGSELCRQIMLKNPRRLLLVDQSEPALYLIERELVGLGYSGIFIPVIADICDLSRMETLINHYRPEIIFHAAAHKHVPMMEYQPGEAIKNNTLGTTNLAELASVANVGRFILVSTDKAINPTNAMGASKRLAEIGMQSIQAKPGNRTLFSAVRFGNVLGSSGSVVPLFRKQILNGGPVTVTHPEVSRYFMTIPEAVGLVLQSATMAVGGDIFVLDMGEPVRISKLAEQMICLSGYRPNIDIEIKYVGLRPGEKLFEELQHELEYLEKTTHPRVMRMVSTLPDYEEIRQKLELVRETSNEIDPKKQREILKSLVPEYSPYVC